MKKTVLFIAGAALTACASLAQAASITATKSPGAVGLRGDIGLGPIIVNGETTQGTKRQANLAGKTYRNSVSSVGGELNIPVGPIALRPGAKAIYMENNIGKGSAVALGGTVTAKLGSTVSLVGSVYHAPEALTRNALPAYTETTIGASYRFSSVLTLNAGWQSKSTHARSGRNDNRNVISEGLYFGMGAAF